MHDPSNDSHSTALVEDPHAAPENPRTSVAPAAKEPSSRSKAGSLSPNSFAMSALLALAVFFTLYLTRDFLLPIVVAFVLSLVFRPVVRTLERRHIPAPLTAMCIMGILIAGLVYGLSSLYEPAMRWTARAPDAVDRIEQKINEFRRPMADAGLAAKSVQRITAPADGEPVVTVREEKPGLGQRLLTGALGVITSVGIGGFLLFFLLATGGRLISRFTAFIIAHRPNSRRHVELLGTLESQVSRYLATITIINCCLGVAVGSALWALGMPNPILWGVVVAALNFVPYVGGAVGATLVGLVATLAFDDPWRMAMAPGAYIALNILEGMLITPMILGRRFAVDPCVVFIWLVFWSWMWGVPGGILAMPLLAIVKITSDQVPSWNTFGQLISVPSATARGKARSDPVRTS